MRTLRDPSGWKKNLPLYYSDFEEKKPKHLHPFFFFPRRFLSLNAPIFITISITFSHISRYVMERNVMEGKGILIHAAGRASSTFPLKRPLNHNLFGPSFHCISLKMIYALFVAENFRSEIASERVLANPASKTEALKTEYASKFPPQILQFFYLRPISLEFPLKTETRAELSNFSQICFRFTMKQKKKKNNKNKNKRNIYT